MRNNNQNTNAFLLHISSFMGYLFPLGNIITPLVLWQTQKNRSSFLDKHGKEAVNFNISFSIYLLILSASLTSLSFTRSFNIFKNTHINLQLYNHNLFEIVSLAGILGLIKITLIIIAAMKANEGEPYQYPFTINFIK